MIKKFKTFCEGNINEDIEGNEETPWDRGDDSEFPSRKSKDSNKKVKNNTKCEKCDGWINPSWTRGDGDYRHCECPRHPARR